MIFITLSREPSFFTTSVSVVLVSSLRLVGSGGGGGGGGGGGAAAAAAAGLAVEASLQLLSRLLALS